jgi:outer membrane receptor protein involved in Fe transport
MRRLLLFLVLAAFLPLRAQSDTARRSFDIPAGDATVTLRHYTEQSGEQVVYIVPRVRGITTKAVKGEFTSLQAIEHMVANTTLTVVQDEKTRALMVHRRAGDPPGKRPRADSPPITGAEEPHTVKKSPKTIARLFPALLAAFTAAEGTSQTTAPRPTTEDAVQMNAFRVGTDKDYGYRKMSSVTSSRSGEEIARMPQAIEVVSGELLQDFLANNGNQAFRYSASVSAKENVVGQADMFNLRGFALPRYYNGVALPNALSLVPINIWDNIDRIEVVKGPVGLYYANTTPNGVANYITKKPQFTNATSLELTVGTYDFQKAILDYQHVLGKYAAVRFIASASERGSGYRDGSPSRYTFISPSVVIRPFKTVEITAELDYLSEHNGYQGGANAWNFSINPQWQQDLRNPNAQILQYFQTRFNLASADAARTFIQQRWSPPNSPAGPALATWSSDILAITGTAPFLYTTQKIDWSIYSPRGERFAPQSKQSTYGGNSPTYEVSVAVTPLPELSFRYHWVHGETRQQFVRQILQPNTNGFRPDGRVNSLDAANLALQGFDNFSRRGTSDTQQFDVHYRKDLWNIKHKFGAGFEALRITAVNTVAPLDFTRAGTITTPDGRTLTGIQIYQNYDPFGPGEVPSLYALQSGPSVINGRASLSKNHQYYGSYRASMLQDRVNLLFGVNRFVVRPSGQFNTPVGKHNTTYTYGIIGEVLRGISLFASQSESVQFTNQQSSTGIGVLPSDNVRTLNSEQDEGYEFGVKSTWRDDQITGTVSYYNNTRDGVVSGDVLRTLTDPRNTAGTFVQHFVNGGLYRSRGIDADLTWTPNRAFQLVFNYNHSLEARIVSDPSVNPTTPGTLDFQKKFRRPLSQSPKNRFNLVGKYNILEGVLKNTSIGAAVRYSDTYSVTNGTTSDLWVPQQTMFDAFVAHRVRLFTIPTDVKVNVNNITNERDDYTFGDGRTAYLSLGFRF